MPGIVGLITEVRREQAEQELLAMLGTLRHEPFYVTGTWCDESLGVYVGWAARQGSFSDGMPLTNESGSAVLVFSGEDHPEAGTPSKLKERGHAVQPDGPSYLVHLYEEDPAFPAGLNGWFHGLIADRRRGTVVVFNDRFGMHRLYYHESKDAFYFAAEAKAILAVRPELRTVNPKALGEFVALGCVVENRSLFQGIQVLPPGSAWSFRNGSLERNGTYFQPQEWEQQTLLKPEPFYQELKDAFSRNLPRYFNGGQRVGMSLTGGLDTRAIMAWYRGGSGFPSVLHVWRNIPRVPRRDRGPAGGARLPSALSSPPLWPGVYLPFSPLCRADGLLDGRLRGCQLFAGPLRHSAGARDCSGKDDGELWRSDPPPVSDV